MSSKDQSLSAQDLSSIPSAEGYKIHVVVSEWNSKITSALLKGALDTLEKLKVSTKGDCEVVHVPGTFELPMAAKTLIKAKQSDAVICLGCVIKGETDHDKYINQSVAIALNQLAVMTDKPIIFGVLTVNNMEQALDRAGGQHGNKGIEAAVTAVKMVHLQKGICESPKAIGF